MIVDCIFFDKNDFVFFSNKLLLWEFVEVERVCIWKECIYGKSLCMERDYWNKRYLRNLWINFKFLKNLSFFMLCLKFLFLFFMCVRV